MKILITILLFSIASAFTNLHAQNLKRPLTAKVINEPVSASPGEGWSWVKGHWEWDGTRYTWRKGMYTETKKGSEWIDGEWERNQKSGWWKYNDGYWRKVSDESDVENDKNTSEKDKAGKEKRHQNKTSGLFIKTGSSK